MIPWGYPGPRSLHSAKDCPLPRYPQAWAYSAHVLAIVRCSAGVLLASGQPKRTGVQAGVLFPGGRGGDDCIRIEGSRFDLQCPHTLLDTKHPDL